jgi:very-short-patch-repair endonuclease
MATKRKNSTRTGWEGVVKRLSKQTSGSVETGESGEGHSGAVAGGKSRRKGGMVSNLELMLHLQMQSAGIMGYMMEYKFHPVRRWRFDFCWVERKLVVEVEGGTWSGGRHTTGSGFRKDCEKYNHAAWMGYLVFRFTSDMVKNGEAINWIEEMING